MGYDDKFLTALALLSARFCELSCTFDCVENLKEILPHLSHIPFALCLCVYFVVLFVALCCHACGFVFTQEVQVP